MFVKDEIQKKGKDAQRQQRKLRQLKYFRILNFCFIQLAFDSVFKMNCHEICALQQQGRLFHPLSGANVEQIRTSAFHPFPFKLGQ